MQTDRETKGWFWVTVQGVLILAWMLGLLLGIPWQLPNTTRYVVEGFGLLLAVAGVALALIAAVQLGNNLTPVPQPRSSGSLVTTGIYGHARHPIYGGILLLVTGFTVMFLTPLAGIFALILVIFFVLKSYHEEGRLRRKFPEYDRYAELTKRFIPWII
jgi:protein-S-isoprenylcysteine O-methyltransferase Ste14